tara:strand:- start:222 stop:512 length:291 start_codon:yes stop_codon:yes gene_type:complete
MSEPMSASDRAIKKSAEDISGFEPMKRSADRITGDHAQAVINAITLDYDPNYTHVHVVDFPEFDPAFNFYRVNFYYQTKEDPTTRISSFIVKKEDV